MRSPRPRRREESSRSGTVPPVAPRSTHRGHHRSLGLTPRPRAQVRFSSEALRTPSDTTPGPSRAAVPVKPSQTQAGAAREGSRSGRRGFVPAGFVWLVVRGGEPDGSEECADRPRLSANVLSRSMAAARQCESIPWVPRHRVMAVVGVTAILAAGGSSSAGSTCRNDIACRITADAVDGVRPGMTPQELHRRWRIPIRAPEVVLGSDSVAYAAICDGETRGWARFWGPNGGPFALTELHFTRGAQTNRGVRIGSSRADVRNAYGTRAVQRKHSTALDVLGHPRLRYGANEPSARPVLVFQFRRGRVDEIVFGWRDSIRGNWWRYEISALPRC